MEKFITTVVYIHEPMTAGYKSSKTVDSQFLFYWEHLYNTLDSYWSQDLVNEKKWINNFQMTRAHKTLFISSVWSDEDGRFASVVKLSFLTDMHY